MDIGRKQGLTAPLFRKRDGIICDQPISNADKPQFGQDLPVLYCTVSDRNLITENNADADLPMWLWLFGLVLSLAVAANAVVARA